MTNRITKEQVVEMIDNLTNGTIYSVSFIKRDGSKRLMNSIKGTSRGVKGVGSKYDARAKKLLPVYDLQIAKQNPEHPEKAWRTINLESVYEISVNREKFEVI